MDLLVAANLSGLNTINRDRDGHSPNECFMKCRSAHCAVARKPIGVERMSWLSLMKSASRRSEFLLNLATEDEESGVILGDICDERQDPFGASETSSDSTYVGRGIYGR